MEENLKYKRILLKLSGEALLGEQQFGIDQNPLEMIANEVKQAYDLGAEIAIVVGGGNIFRGVKNSAKYGMDQATGDYIGMLATVMNALALQSALRKLQEIDWSRYNEENWLGRTLREGGKVMNSEEAVTLTCSKIKQLIDIPLNKEELAKEAQR